MELRQPNRTIGDRLNETDGRPTGFDYLRILLACAVVVTHSVPTSYGNFVADRIYWLPGIHAASLMILPMFFGLSGFLIAGSLSRSRSMVGFLGLRFIRIYPALAVEVLLSALFLGPFFTTLSLTSYLSDPIFWRYLLNVTGDVSFRLPGVFENNPVPSFVNQQLWTVPYELYCYVVIAAVAITTVLKRRKFVLWGVITAQLASMAVLFASRPEVVFKGEFARHIEGVELVFAFLAGVLLYLYRDLVPWSAKNIAIAAFASALLFSMAPGEYFGVFWAAYLVVGLGLLNPPKLKLMRTADYSYGVFLYGWPIQQALVAQWGWARHAALNAVATLALSFILAAVSWHVVEKPSLLLRKPLAGFEQSWISGRDELLLRLRSLLNSALETFRRRALTCELATNHHKIGDVQP